MKYLFTKLFIIVALSFFIVQNVLSQSNTPCGAPVLTVNGSCINTAGTTVAATYSSTAANGGVPTCASPGAPDVWYSFVAPAGGSVTINTTANSITDGGMALYNGPCATPTQIICDDDGGTGLMPMISQAGLTPGVTYYIRFWAYGGTNTGTFSICVTTGPSPATNNECTTAIPLTVNPNYNCGTVTPGTILGATASAQANTCGGTANDDVWFSFVATGTSHTVDLLNVAGSTTDLYHSVYSGTCGIIGVPIVCSDPNNSVLTGLIPGHTYYVRVYSWGSTIGQTSTFDVCIGTPPPPPTNDNCTGAIALTVNPDQACGIVTPGYISGATASSQTTTCFGTADDDVWFSFIATNTTHNISLLNITGSTSDMYFSVYPGSCGALGTEVICSDPETNTVNGLTVGATYYVRVYTYTSTVGQTSAFNICVGTPPPPVGAVNCSVADPFCTGTTYDFPMNTNNGSGEVGPDYGCLCSTPNPVWYYLHIATSGPIGITISSTCGDIDYAAWGPFSSTTCATSDLTSNGPYCTTTNYTAPSGNMVDCAFSTAATEVLNIPAAVIGQYYMVMITNYANCVGNAVFSQTSGSGATDCSIVIPCDITAITTNISNCPTVGGTYTVSGTITFNDQPTTGTLTICDNVSGLCQTFSAPFVSPLAYSISGITANGGSHTLTASFSAEPFCTQSQIYTATNPPISATYNFTNPTCSGGSNGTASITGQAGGYPAYSYTWSPNVSSTASASGLSAGSYNVTITDTHGCTATHTFTLTNPPAWVAVLTPTATTCGLNNGSVTVTSVTNGTGPYTYAWSNGGNTVTISSLPSGNYTVTVTGAGGCTAVATANVAASSALTSTFTQSANQCLTGNSFNFNNTGSSGGGYLYSWTFPSGTPSSSTTNNQNNVSWSVAGTYTITHTVTYGGCSSTTTSTITIYPQPTVTVSPVVNVTCNGLCNGTATANPSGVGYSYVWNDPTPVQLTQTANTLCAGNYNVTVTNQNGCTGIGSVTITQPGVIVLNSSRTDVTCNGLCNGTANVVITSGGTAPFTYNWGAGSTPTSATTSSLCAGSYTVTVTDANGCTATSSVTIAQPAVLNGTIVGTNPTCNGATNGSANLTVTGGTTPYAYSWSNSATTEDLSGIGAGTFTVTITDSKGCTKVVSVTLTAPISVTANISSQVNVSCNGGANGTATVAVGGGTAPYSYLWNDPIPQQITATATTLTAGTWTVTVTDANGCTATANVTITQPVVLSGTIAGTNPTCNGATNGSANLTVTGGTTPYTYSWSNTATTEDLSGIGAGTYTVTITDSKGCTTTASVTLSAPAVVTATISVQINVSCNGGSNGTATVTAGGGTAPYTYLWNDPAPQQTTLTATTLTAGTWTVTVTDANGCTATTTVTITQPAVLNGTIVGTNPTCNGATNGSANLTVTGGTTPYAYSWSNSATTEDLSGIGAGTYTVTITDSKGCTTTASVTLSAPVSVVATISAQTNVSCNGGANGTATVSASGGTAPYTYLWNDPAPQQTTSTATTLTAGTWMVTVTDANGCTATANVTITQPVVLSGTIAGTNPTCNGSTNGSANLTVIGGTTPYTYSWSNTATTEDLSGIGAGTYTVTITDSKGCTTTANVTLSAPTVVTATISAQTNVSCNGGANGTATVTAGGGTAPYTYLWNDPAPQQTTLTATTLTAGTWTVTITDANGCTATTTVTITQPTLLTSSITAQTNILCSGGSNGTATVTASGGTTPYSYLWNDPAPQQTTSTATTLTAGTWTVTITDANGCTATTTVTITQPTFLTSSITAQTNILCSGGSNGTATVTASGGTTPYTYLWNDPAPQQTTSTATTLTAGSWTVTVTDANGCTTTVNVTITQPIVLNALTSGTPASCNGGSNGTATVTPSGGTTPYSYNWQNLQTTQNIVGLTIGNYSVTVTDANGCSVITSYTVNEPIAITLTPSSVNATCGNANGSASVAVSGGTSPYTYIWTGGYTTNSIVNVVAGSYTVTVTDANGCTATNTININNFGAPTANITSSTNITCNGLCNGTATVTAAGGTLPYNYLWSSGGTTTNTSGLCAGTESVTVTDALGCVATASIVTTEPTALITAISAQTNVSCNGGANGSATVSVSGGTSPYSYLWNDPAPQQNTATATTLTAGTWTVTVSDANGCTSVSNVIITEPTILSANITGQTNILCNGGSNGDATVTTSGGTSPYTYLWNDPAPQQTTPICSGLTAGTWTVTVTDANGCTNTANVVITGPTVVTANISSQTNISCNAGADGSATVSASGGTSPYTYLWNDPAPQQTTSIATTLTAGTWNVTVTDANGCTAITNVVITEPIILTANISAQTNVNCNGGSDGTATVTAGGGISPYNYLWNDPAPQQITATATTLTVGTWTVTVTDANGCTATTNVVISEPTVITANIIVQTNVSCNGGSDGTASVAAGGGTLPYTYLWDDPAPQQTTSTATGLSAGTWMVTVTDANSCTATTSVVITEPTPIIANIIGIDALCNGGLTGSADLTVSGGTSIYTYNWSNSSTTEDLSGIGAGTYSVTITDANSCTTTSNLTINEPTTVTASITSSTNTSGFGICDGDATVSGLNGTPTYTYLWSNSSTLTTITALCAGTYTVTVTDANGCTAVTSVNIVEPNAVIATITATTNLNCNGVCIGTATVSAIGGVSPYTYLWPNSQATITATGLCAGSFIVTVTDSNGITGTATATITEPTILTSSIGSQTNVSCNGGSDGTASVAAGGGTLPYTYLWDDPAPQQTTSAATSLTAGTWTVTVTDTNGCTSVSSVTITEPTLLTANILGTNVPCNGQTTGNANLTVLGGSPSYTFIWSTSATSEDLSGIGAGTYSVTVTDANSCTAIASINIIEPTLLTATTSTSDAHCGQSDGSATVTPSNGTPSYTYLWTNSQTGNAATGLSAGGYSVTITDANGCSIISSVTINNLSGGVATITGSTPANCFGSSDGSATASMLGAVSYLWDNSSTTATVNNLNAGTHTVTVTDNNGCQSIASVNISEPTAITSTISGTDVLCNGTATGTIDLTPSNGTPIYSFNWSNSLTTEDLTGVVAGNYSVTITDSNGCTSTNNLLITEPTLLLANITTSTNTSCNGGSNGTAIVLASNGTPGYTYLWNGGTANTSDNNIGFSAGNYSVTVTDLNGCTASTTVTITEPTAINLTMLAIDENCGQSNGSATVVASGGTVSGGYTYSWSGGTTPTLSTTSGLTFGTYSVTVADDNNCTAIGTVTVTNLAPGTASISSFNNVSCNGVCDADATVSIGGGIPPFTYAWSNGATTSTATNLCLGTYTVTSTDANGCMLTASVTITEPLVMTSSFNPNQPVCYGNCNGMIITTVNGGTSPYSYQWDDPLLQTIQNPISLCTGTYNVTITDVNGCLSTSSVNLGQPPQITSSAVPDDANCNLSDGGLTLSITNGIPPFTFLWSNSATTQNLTNVPAGTYTVTITDFKGCTGTGTYSINNLIGPTATISSSTNISCFGVCDGTAVVNAIGGTSPYTYLWDNSQTSQTGTILCVGNHSVTVSDVNGCQANANIVITQPIALNSSTTTTNPTCNNYCNGTATVLVAGGTSPYSYNWTNGDNLSVADSLCDGNYTVIVTDLHGCTTMNTININEPTFIAIATSTTPVLCYNACNGTATANPVGGTPPYNYLWSDLSAQTTPTATGLCAGAYTVSVYDLNGCLQTAIVNITEPSLLTSNISNIINVSCFGGNNGSAQANGNGGSPAYSYLWSNSGTSQTINNLTSGIYNVTITDFNGCTSTSQITITQPQILSTVLTPLNETCFNACNGSISSSVTGGTTPYQYAWSNAQNTPNINNLCVGAYDVTITDAQNCIVTSNSLITGPSLLIVVTTNENDASCGQATGSATIAASGGTGSNYTYTWNPNVSNNVFLNNVVAGAYNVTVTDINGCTATTTVNVNNIGAPIITSMVVTNISCKGGNNGTATVTYNSSTINNNILWSDPLAQTSTTAIGLTAGNYFVIITDANGCTTSGNAIITEPPILNSLITQTNSTLCYGSCNGSANVIAAGGTSPYNYVWNDPLNQTTALATNLCAGFVSVVISDANGCTSSSNTTINQPTQIVATGTTIPVNCNGGSDGSVTVSATGGTPGYSYNWLPYGGTSSTAANLPANSLFNVIITDANSCTSQASFTLTEPTPIVIQTVSSDARCNMNNGMALATVSGGTPSYTYFWSPSGDTSPQADSLASGNHIIQVTDSHNCSSMAVVQVNDLPMPELVSSIVTNANCYGSSDGKIQIHVLHGQMPFNYLWSPYGSNDSISSGLPAGIYTVSIIDGNGCQITSNPIIVNQPTPVVVNANGTDTICIGQSITISASAMGGTPTYTYLWDNSLIQQSQTVNPNVTTNYTITATDSHGCTSSTPGNVTIYVNPPLNVSLPADIDICEGQPYSISANASGGYGSAYIYNWNFGSGNPNVVSPNTTTTYIVTVHDICNTPPASDSITITVHPLPIMSSPPNYATGCEPLTATFNNVVFTLDSVGYLWNFGDPTSGAANTSTDSDPSHTYESTGNYMVNLTLTSQYGCQTTISYPNIVSVTPAPIANFYTYPTSGIGVFDATIHFYDQSLYANQWQWSFGDGGYATSQSPMHEYINADTLTVTLIVTANNGCTDTVSQQFIVRPEQTFYAPTAFAPNTGIGNNYFYPKGIGFDPKSYHLFIFDRWGQLVFETTQYPEGTDNVNEIEGGWNGKFKNSGDYVQIGTYTWLIQYKDINGLYHEEVGPVTVIR